MYTQITLTGQEIPKAVKEKRKVSLLDKILIVIGVIALLTFTGFTLASHKNSSSKTSAKGPTSVPLVQPDFSAYYPKTIPEGLSISKNSITYSKNSFTFIIKQADTNRFFVYEQPASTDPNFNNLKSSLTAPKSITLPLGQGVAGGLNTGSAAAVKTDKDVMIIVNDSKSAVPDTAQQILSSMQVTNDVASLRKGDL